MKSLPRTVLILERVMSHLRVCCFSLFVMWGTLMTAQAEVPLVFVSSFAPIETGGLHAFHLNTESGALTPVEKTGGIAHPFFFAISRDQRFLYSIDAKTFSGSEPEHVAAYALEGRTGRLKLLNRQPTGGKASCYIDIDASGKSVLVANYTTGEVASYPVGADGSLGAAVSFIQHTGSSVNPARQKEPHAHCLVISPDNRFAFAADLGLDQILNYRLDTATAKLSPNTQPFVRTLPGAGPRHLIFNPRGDAVYVINELKNSVTRFQYLKESGLLIEKETISTLPDDFTGTTACADLKITPDGKFLYGTNRGHDSIAAYRIADDGVLSLIEIAPSLGAGPQNLLIAGDGELLLCANMGGGSVSVFAIDQGTGKLTAKGEPVAIPGPSCLRLVK